MNMTEQKRPPLPLSNLAETCARHGVDAEYCELLAQAFLDTAAELRRAGLALLVGGAGNA